MKGPNGIADLRLNCFVMMPNRPNNAPIKVDRKKANKTPLRPKAYPKTANSLISPPPIPPLLTMAMI